MGVDSKILSHNGKSDLTYYQLYITIPKYLFRFYFILLS